MSGALPGTSAPRRVEILGEGGVRLVGDRYGDPRHVPVVLLHGGGQTRHAWGETAAKLGAAGFCATSLDLRGHGDSAWADDGDYSVTRFVEDLGETLATLPQPAALVGASMGGITALLAQAELTQPVRALVLVDIATTAQPDGIRRIIDFMTQKPEGYASLEEVADAIAAYQPHRPRTKNLEGLAKNVRKGTDGRYRWHWDPAFIKEKGPDDDGPLRADRLERAARALTVPTLLVRGRQSDVVAEEDVARFLSYAPHAEYVDVRDAGHMVAGDVNDVFSEVVIAFLRRVS